MPAFFRLIAENLVLCFLHSTLLSTSKYLTGALGLRFRKILTELIHGDYFEVPTIISYGRSSNHEGHFLLFAFLLDIKYYLMYDVVKP